MKYLALLFVLASCLPVPSAPPTPAGEPLLRFRGTMVVSADGRLVLHFDADACGGDGLQPARTCGTFPFNGLPGTFLLTPWGARVPASTGGDAWLGFAVDWRGAGLDPLRDDHTAVLAKPWRFLSDRDGGGKSYWVPTLEDIAGMRAVLGHATGIELEVVNDAAAPQLSVIGLTPRGDLRNGTRAILSLEMENRGAGHANRFIGRTRSSVPALHGLQFSFGRIAPHRRETRSLVVDLPADNDEHEAVIVVEFSEANGFAPAPLSVRLPVRAAAKGVVLELACRVRSAGEGLVTVDAGQSLTIDCVIGNRGVPARGVVVSLEMAGQRAARRSASLELGTDRQQTLTFVVEVPRSAKLDERIALTARARAEGTSATAEARLEVAIARPQICPDGRLDRDAYRAKRDELRKAHADGLLSKEELERYEALLVGCLQ